MYSDCMGRYSICLKVVINTNYLSMWLKKFDSVSLSSNIIRQGKNYNGIVIERCW
jgi:hypothetical protein